jgi:hypothetical protein
MIRIFVLNAVAMFKIVRNVYETLKFPWFR